MPCKQIPVKWLESKDADKMNHVNVKHIIVMGSSLRSQWGWKSYIIQFSTRCYHSSIKFSRLGPS